MILSKKILFDISISNSDKCQILLKALTVEKNNKNIKSIIFFLKRNIKILMILE